MIGLELYRLVTLRKLPRKKESGDAAANIVQLLLYFLNDVPVLQTAAEFALGQTVTENINSMS